MSVRDHHKQRGLTLVEVLVTMTLFLLVLVGVLQIFDSLIKTQRRTEELTVLQNNLRFAMMVLFDSIATTGYLTPRDIMLIPDPECPNKTFTQYCSTDRAANTEGIIVFTSTRDLPFMKPYCVSGGDVSCDEPTTTCSSLTGNILNVCSPSGIKPAEINNQKMMVCGLVDASNTNGCDWAVPVSDDTVTECGVPAGNYAMCCTLREATAGPVCSSGCSRSAEGVCVDAGGNTCPETITVNSGFPPPNFVDTRAICYHYPPVQGIHYQIHEVNGTRFLMVQVNNSGSWTPVASGIIDMQACYILDDVCDPNQSCVEWDWNSPPVCPSTGQPATVRNIRRVRLQITAESANPVLVSGITATPTPKLCIPGAPPPAPKPKHRQLTLCQDVLVRNLEYTEIPPTGWVKQ